MVDQILNDTTDQARTLNETLASGQRAADGFARAISGGLKQAVVEGKSLDSVLKSVALSLSAQALSSALAPFARELGSLATGLGQSLVSAFVGSSPVAHASGGVTGAPGLFAMADGRTGIAGEAGPEAILPLERGTDGSLGIRANGAGSGAIVHVTITTPDAESFRRSEAQVSAMLARAVGRGRRGL